jgi:hypothetical protein
VLELMAILSSLIGALWGSICKDPRHLSLSEVSLAVCAVRDLHRSVWPRPRKPGKLRRLPGQSTVPMARPTGLREALEE